MFQNVERLYFNYYCIPMCIMVNVCAYDTTNIAQLTGTCYMCFFLPRWLVGGQIKNSIYVSARCSWLINF